MNKELNKVAFCQGYLDRISKTNWNPYTNEIMKDELLGFNKNDQLSLIHSYNHGIRVASLVNIPIEPTTQLKLDFESKT